jgi:hypothetical protein
LRSPSIPVSERGDLSAYLAAGLLLPVLLLVMFGGLAAITVGRWTVETQGALAQGLLAAEAVGGVTAAVTDVVEQNLGTDPTLATARVSVTGSQPTVPWGQPVTVAVRVVVPATFPLSLLSPGYLTVQGQMTGTSNAPPP